MTTGSHNEYEWLACEDHDLHTLIERCPEVVLGKHIAVTSFDSGSLSLNDDEKAAGWVTEGGIAYSPHIRSTDGIPHDTYDEWYIFREPTNLGDLVPAGKNVFEEPLRQGHVQVFVNFGAFHLHRADSKPLGDLFWEQLTWINPESYIADGECLAYVTSNKKMFMMVKQALEE